MSGNARMDFGRALAAMRNGHTVRRAGWAALVRAAPDEYAELRLEQPAAGWEEVLVVTTGEGVRTMFNPSHAQLLALDWEIAG